MKSEMVSRAFKVMMMVSGLATLACSTGWAAAVPTVLTFSETYADKVACTGDRSDGFDCNTYSEGKFTITGTITSNDFGSAIDPSSFTGDTTVDISLGEYSLSGTLGEDPKYVAGGKKAKFELVGQVCSANDLNNSLDCPSKVYEMITLTMSTKEITFSIEAETGSDANGNTFESFIDADSFDGDETGPVPADTTIAFEMDLDVLSVSSDIMPVTGKVTTKTVNDKSGDQDDLSTISIKGKLPATDLGQ